MVDRSGARPPAAASRGWAPTARCGPPPRRWRRHGRSRTASSMVLSLARLVGVLSHTDLGRNKATTETGAGAKPDKLLIDDVPGSVQPDVGARAERRDVAGQGWRSVAIASSARSAATGVAALDWTSAPCGVRATAIQSSDRCSASNPVEAHRRLSTVQPAGMPAWTSRQTGLMSTSSLVTRRLSHHDNLK